MSYWVYILLCSDSRFYVGHTSDLKERVAAHQAGRGARFTAVRRPLKSVYSEQYGVEDKAVVRELQIKRWARAKKLALINGDKNRLRVLSISHDHHPVSSPSPAATPA